MLEQHLIAGGVVVFWVVCGVFAYGIDLAYFQRKYPSVAAQSYEEDRRGAWVAALLGPISLIAHLLDGDWRHGLMFRRPKADATFHYVPNRPALDRAMREIYGERVRAQAVHRLSDKPWENVPTRSPFTNDWRVLCPLCDEATLITRQEVEDHSASCTKCRKRFNPHTGKALEPEGGEPAWAEPSDADRAWALATMPGKAKGHVLAWRLWDIQARVPKTGLDKLTTLDLLDSSPSEAWNRLFEIYREIENERTSGEPRYLLQSTASDYTWKPGQPVIGICREHMPIAYGAGIYACKDPRDLADPVFMNAPTCVIGQVALWGDVVEHEHGYRARYAYPVRVWVPEGFEIVDPDVAERIRGLGIGMPNFMRTTRYGGRPETIARELARTYDIKASPGLPAGLGPRPQPDQEFQKHMHQMHQMGRSARLTQHALIQQSLQGGQP